jgi:dihydrodipicolinate synthase/N-acetylneuraminate lyase
LKKQHPQKRVYGPVIGRDCRSLFIDETQKGSPMVRLSLTNENLRGVWPALITPWTADERIDEGLLVGEIQSLAQAGVHGTYTGGTTGEFYAQDDGIFAQLTKTTCREAEKAGLLIQIGCTALSTRTAQNRARFAIDCGASGIQFALPFWMPLDEQETLQFVSDLASAAGTMPLVLYQTMRAKRRIDPPLLGKICREIPTLIGMKDPSSDHETLKRIVADAPDLAVFGTDVDLLERMRLGGSGTYSSVAGLNAGLMLGIYNHCARGEFDQAEPLQDAVRRLMHEVLHPMSESEGLVDSALDRIQRELGGGKVGLRSQKPYRAATSAHVEQVRSWCKQHAPALLP